jgi:hypothetical protein
MFVIGDKAKGWVPREHNDGFFYTPTSPKVIIYVLTILGFLIVSNIMLPTEEIQAEFSPSFDNQEIDDPSND